MKRFALATTALLTLAVAAPAFASDQLAASLGVADQGYSTSELVKLKSAYDNDDSTRVNFILESHEGLNSVNTSSKNYGTTATEQLAGALDVDASDYSRGELVALKAALDADDAAQIAAIKAHAAQNATNNPTAWTQFAASVGMDATTSTPAELVDAWGN